MASVMLDNQFSSQDVYVRMRVRDTNGNVSIAGNKSEKMWLDFTAPNAVDVPTIDNGSIIHVTSRNFGVTWNWTAPKDIGGSGLSSYDTKLQVYSDAQAVSINPNVPSTVNRAVYPPVFTDNVYAFSISAHDRAGNTGNISFGQLFVVDTVAPSVNLQLRNACSAYGWNRPFKENIYYLIRGNTVGLSIYMKDKASEQIGNVGSGIASMKLELYELATPDTGEFALASVPTFSLSANSICTFGIPMTSSVIHTSQNTQLWRYALISDDIVISDSYLSSQQFVDPTSNATANFIQMTLSRNWTGFFRLSLSVKDFANNETSQNYYLYYDPVPPSIDMGFSGMIFLSTNAMVYIRRLDGGQSVIQEDASNGSKYADERSRMTFFPIAGYQLYEVSGANQQKLGLNITGSRYYPYCELEQGAWGSGFMVLSTNAKFYVRVFDELSEEIGFFQGRNQPNRSWDAAGDILISSEWTIGVNGYQLPFAKVDR